MGIYSRRARCACRRAVEVTVGDGDGAHVARIARAWIMDDDDGRTCD